MSDEYDFDSVEEVDAEVEELADLFREERGDLAVAIDILLESAQEADDETDLDDVVDDITLPFRDEDREVTFSVGMMVGALLEARENVADENHRLGSAMPDQQSTDAGDIGDTY